MSDIERSDFLAAAGMTDDSEAKFFSAAEIAGKLRAERDAAVKELAIIDERLSRRPALADCQTRADKIDRLCSRAGQYESVRAELDDLRQSRSMNNPPQDEGDNNGC